MSLRRCFPQDAANCPQDAGAPSREEEAITLHLTFGIGPAPWYKPYMLRFTKMNGAGNDFVMIDNRASEVQLSSEQIAKICDRHRGVGADGILLIEPATNSADFRMRYYNRDGGEAEMCGNGARCFARYVE